MSYLEALRKAANVTLTENGGKAYESTLDPCLDFFALGASKRKDQMGAVQLFLKAFAKDQLTAIRTLFYIRDVRGGQGERDTFRYCLSALLKFHPDVFEKVIKYVPEYGRWDDLLVIPGATKSQAAVALVREQLAADITSSWQDEISLLAKWMPSENASSKDTKKLAEAWAKALGYRSMKAYRKDIVKLRKRIGLLEHKMSWGKWHQIQYDKLPGQALVKHLAAFYRHDEERYTAYLEGVKNGKKGIHTETISTDNVFQAVENGAPDEAADTIWKMLENFVSGDNNGIVMADVSGSMYGRPLRICTSLALYFAERNKGEFANKFLTFSRKPQLVEVVGNTLAEKLANINRADWDMNTDISAAFDTMLDAAIASNATKEELPSTIYVISDMEFDECATGVDQTAFERAAKKWHDAGYELPHVVFWNVDARNNHLPATIYNSGVTLISGSNQSAFKYAFTDKTPADLMNNVINSARYQPITLD